ncbi:MAG TPA: hydroxymethylglutaryl-CoA synthase [Thermoprotei archaeon]|nr:hydroxymethylglutaryl-CoA synthase [Thermoprotei archaeon]
MKPMNNVGIVGYGGYIPIYRIKDEEIGSIWSKGSKIFPIKEKSVSGLDEDVVTMSVEASLQALKVAGINPNDIGAVFVGAESHPYAVKPSATIIAEAIGAVPKIIAVDMEFACRAGSTAMQNIIGLVGSGMIRYGLAIGADTAQGRPGDELEYTAAAGAAAFIIGSGDESLAIFESTYSYVTDTPDFWRRDGEYYPRHALRFTGEPAYFKHIISAARGLMEESGLKPEDFDYAVFHQPNVKFPLKAGKILGFTKDKILPGLLSNSIGNTYAGASLLGLVAVLDIAKPGDRILMVSFGSGAGSDAFNIVVTDKISRRNRKRPLATFIKRKKYINYAIYAKFRRKIRIR